MGKRNWKSSTSSLLLASSGRQERLNNIWLPLIVSREIKKLCVLNYLINILFIYWFIKCQNYIDYEYAILWFHFMHVYVYMYPLYSLFLYLLYMIYVLYIKDFMGLCMLYLWSIYVYKYIYIIYVYIPVNNIPAYKYLPANAIVWLPHNHSQGQKTFLVSSADNQTRQCDRRCPNHCLSQMDSTVARWTMVTYIQTNLPVYIYIYIYIYIYLCYTYDIYIYISRFYHFSKMWEKTIYTKCVLFKMNEILFTELRIWFSSICKN